MSGDALRVTVVIPTYLRPALLARCLDAVLAQTLDARAFDVVVVDDGASADTARIVHERQERAGAPAITYLATRGREGPAVARNRGWRAARGEVIAFTDDDTVPDRRWLEHGLQALVPPAVAAHGRIVVPTPQPPTDYERNTKGLETAGFVTANCFVRKSALAQVGGFDERFRRAWREDADLYFSLMERAGSVVAAPAAIVVHPVRDAGWGECLRQHANLVFDALLYKKHPRLYRRQIRARPPWGYYVSVLATASASAAAMGGAPAVAAALAAVALLPVARLASRRLAGTSPRPRHRLEVIVTSFAIPFVAVYWRLRGAVRFRVLFL
jgi:glycosyltransferase involved in cell wall biosynthesis